MLSCFGGGLSLGQNFFTAKYLGTVDPIFFGSANGISIYKSFGKILPGSLALLVSFLLIGFFFGFKLIF